MKDQSVTFGPSAPRDLTRLIAALSAFPKDIALRVVWGKAADKRSETQNSKLWAIYSEILDIGGEELRGWTKDDLHEFFLGEKYGWEVKELFGKKRQTPIRRSSKLTKPEFADFIESIYVFMSHRGVYLS